MSFGEDLGRLRRSSSACEPRRNRGPANALDHGGESLSGETIDQIRSARIHIHHPGEDADRVETRRDHQRVKPRADQRVASGLPLQRD
jgi:hypothetical protein